MGPLPPGEALSILDDVAAGLEAIHASGIVHRDLKPSNVMLVPEPMGGHRGVVTDFGIAVGGAEERLTQPGAIVGTPVAMAPEQRSGQAVGPRTDVYALALLAREMVTAQGGAEESGGRLPPSWRGPVERSLDADPSRRHPTPRALVDALRGRRGMRRAWSWRIAVAMVLAIGLGTLVLRSGRPVSPAAASLAVLPLTNLSPDPSDGYLSEGLTEDILTELAHLRGLKVISRTSSAAYRGTTKSLRQIAEELGVATVLEGSVRRAGGRVRISLQLIDARSDGHLWAETYDRDARERLCRSVRRSVASGTGFTVSVGDRSGSTRDLRPLPAPNYLRASYRRTYRNGMTSEVIAGFTPRFA